MIHRSDFSVSADLSRFCHVCYDIRGAALMAWVFTFAIVLAMQVLFFMGKIRSNAKVNAKTGEKCCNNPCTNV